MNAHQAGPPVTSLEVSVPVGEPPSARLVAELNTACATAEDAAGRVPLVLRLGGGAAQQPQPAHIDVHLVNKWERALRRVERIGTVTVAVAGAGAGAGAGAVCTDTALEALLCCDYRIATAETKLGIPVLGTTPWPGMALHRLVTQLGVARARQLALFAPQVDASRALALGLLDEITEDTEAALAALMARCRDVAGSEVAVRRRLLLEATTTGFDEALGAHLAACDRTLRHERGRSLTEPSAQW